MIILTIGYVHVQSCLLIIYQYKPIRTDWVLYWEFPIHRIIPMTFWNCKMLHCGILFISSTCTIIKLWFYRHFSVNFTLYHSLPKISCALPQPLANEIMYLKSHHWHIEFPYPIICTVYVVCWAALPAGWQFHRLHNKIIPACH